VARSAHRHLLALSLVLAAGAGAPDAAAQGGVELSSGGTLTVPVTAAAAGVIARRTLRATAVVRAYDDPRDPRNRRAPGTRPCRQSGTFEQPLALRPR
jgi:hypothetical protein